MKKVLLVLLVPVLFGVLGSCVSMNYPEPAFDKPAAYVIDADTVKGRMKDNVRLVNNSSDSNISFTIYVHDPRLRKWFTFGTGFLKGANDTDFVDSDDGIDDYRYFAVESLNGKDYAYRVTKRHSDLYISILDK